ncbi:MAG: M56 family metallopeptidase [Bacteroidales bacterium]|nr:M56 family metallopeptidase [Bacteroidales bacterium]MCM1414685.1 M56 family metallopeptidase [bacterium]MCM1422494.1 M56 family metallopeptidase [bacterium]
MKEILITSTVLIISILLIRRIFRGKISSRLQYALWLLVALRLALPVSAQFDLGPFSRFRLLDLVEEDQSGIAQRLEETVRLEEPIRMTVSSGNVLFRLFTTDDIKETLEGMPDDGPTSVFLAGTLGFSRLDVLWFLWGIGALVVGVWIVASNILFSRRLKKTRQPFDLPESMRTAVFDGAKESGGKNGNRLFSKASLRMKYFLANNLSSPCLYGFPGREAVYLTAEVVEDAERLRHVITHELVHKKHGDSFWALLRSIFVTVYWFHPLVWAAAVCSKRDCELACDERALAILGEEERISYGETLLSIITRKGRISDLFCTATTMTGSGKSVKERIRFIAKEPKVFYAAAAGALVLIAAVCLFVFTRDVRFRGVTVDSREGLVVMGADMQIQLPASIGGISGCVTERESDDIVIYHVAAQEEVGRFSQMPLADALDLADEGREVMPIGYYGRNDLLRVYLGEPYSRTEHTYTPAESVTEHTYTPADGATQGVLSHEDVYLPNETITVADETATVEMSSTHTYTPAEGVPGTDSNVIVTDVETYVLDEDDKTYVLNDEEELSVDYLPNENITTSTYQPVEVNADNIDNNCYVYVRADFDKAPEKYREEMEFIDNELQKAADGVIVLSLNRELREQLFDALTENRTPYVGDASKVGALLDALPLPPTMNRTGDFSLQTAKEPYSLRFSYEMSTDLFTQEDKDMLYFNAAMLFYAIGNVEELAIEIKSPRESAQMAVYYNNALEQEFSALREVDYEDEKAFREGLPELAAAVAGKFVE